MIIHDDAVVNVKSGGSRQFSIWNNADSNHDQVRCNLPIVGQINSRDLPITTKSGDAGRQHELYAMCGMFLLIERRYLWRDDAAHHAVFHLDNGNVRIKLRRNGCNFKADITGADDNQPRTLRELTSDAGHVRNGAQIMNAVEFNAGQIERSWPRTGGEYQCVECERLAVSGMQGLTVAIDCVDPGLESYLYARIIVKTFRFEMQPFCGQFTGKEFLR